MRIYYSIHDSVILNVEPAPDGGAVLMIAPAEDRMYGPVVVLDAEQVANLTNVLRRLPEPPKKVKWRDSHE